MYPHERHPALILPADYAVLYDMARADILCAREPAVGGTLWLSGEDCSM
jgi:hypothetical protein